MLGLDLRPHESGQHSLDSLDASWRHVLLSTIALPLEQLPEASLVMTNLLPDHCNEEYLVQHTTKL